MLTNLIPEPFQFNPLKHHLDFMREFISCDPDGEYSEDLIRQIKHTGTSVMDVYSGQLPVNEIIQQVRFFLGSEGHLSSTTFAEWTGIGFSDFRLTVLSDGSQWTLKYHQSNNRYVHLFPARSSPHTFRVKANTLKSAMLYMMKIGKDYITGEDLNSARALAGLSPVKEIAETEAISEMIEILRS